jgi:hypothetical protein
MEKGKSDATLMAFKIERVLQAKECRWLLEAGMSRK